MFENEYHDDENHSSSESDGFSSDDEFVAMRQQRLSGIRKRQAVLEKYLALQHGEVTTIQENEVLDVCKNSTFVVMHFFHKDFERCKLMDAHLKNIAPQYLGTRFCRIEAEFAAFFCSKLNVQILPCVIMFKGGIGGDRIVGFEGIGNETDEFTTKDLIRRLNEAHMLYTGMEQFDNQKNEDEDRNTGRLTF
ncbi:hypothetical protein PCE1_001593 [Barthelona sp. PCE]